MRAEPEAGGDPIEEQSNQQCTRASDSHSAKLKDGASLAACVPSSIGQQSCSAAGSKLTRGHMEKENYRDQQQLASAANNKKMKKVPSRFRRICVFCGSSPGKKASYHLAAVQLGHHLVERGIDLVYGGGSVGLMGLVSRAVHGGGGHVLGIVPKSVLPRELIGETLGELKAVSGMHQRKAEMARHSDAFVALPGGYGTLEELLEVITWAQLRIHHKPVGLLNVDGYYDSLLSFIDNAVREGFVTPAARRIIVAARTPSELLSKLEDYVPPPHDADADADESIKLNWETEVSMEQQIGAVYSPKPDMAR